MIKLVNKKKLFIFVLIIIFSATFLQSAPKTYDSLGNTLERYQKDCIVYLKNSDISQDVQTSCKKFNSKVDVAFKLGYRLDKSAENKIQLNKYLSFLKSAEEDRERLDSLIHSEATRARKRNDIKYYSGLTKGLQIRLSSKDYEFMDKYSEEMRSNTRYIQHIANIKQRKYEEKRRKEAAEEEKIRKRHERHKKLVENAKKDLERQIEASKSSKKTDKSFVYAGKRKTKEQDRFKLKTPKKTPRDWLNDAKFFPNDVKLMEKRWGKSLKKKRKEWAKREASNTIYKKNTKDIEVRNKERQRRIAKVELHIDRYRHDKRVSGGNADSHFDSQISYGVKIQKALVAGKPLIGIPSFVGISRTLSQAVIDKDLEKIKDLLALGADTENWFDPRSPVLRLAVSVTWSANLNEYEQMLSIIYYLLKYGAKIHDDTGWNNLMQAIMIDRIRGTTALTKLFLENGGNVNLSSDNENLSSGSVCSGCGWFTSLYSAVYGKNIEIVKLIVESGVDLNRYDDRGFTALDEIYYQLHRKYMPYQRKYELSPTDRAYLLSIRDYLISKGAKYRIKSNKR